MREVGLLVLGLGLLVLVAGQGLFFYASRRKITYGIEGDNLRLQPNKVLIIGLLTALALLIGGGAMIALSGS